MKLPDFQRDWIWDDDRIRGLIASLSQGYPMGAIMRLQYGNPDIRFAFRAITGAPKMERTIPDTLILDGQQRLTSIYQATYSDKPVETTTENNKEKKIQRFYYLSIEKCLNENEDRIEAVISVPADRQIKVDFNRKVEQDLSTHELEYAHKMFPVNIVFDNSAVMDWMMGFMAYYNYDSAAGDQFKKFQNDVLNTITSYKLPVITLTKATPREAVCKVFENVNTGGVPLTVFELVTATYATHGEFKLRDDWRKCRDRIRGVKNTLQTDLFDGIDETAFLTTVCLYTSYVDKMNHKTNAVSCKKRDVLALPFESYIKNRDAVLTGFNIAREFLVQYQFVFRRRDLPYTTQIIPLAAICAYLGKSKCSQPNTIDKLSKWYWCGILGEMYGGANETRYANDIEDMIDEVFERPNPQHTVNSAVFSSTRLLTLQTRNSAAYKGIMALLYQAKCRDFMNNIAIDSVNSMIESPDIHHIFPESFCEKTGISKSKYNSIVNKTPMLPATNRALGGNAPSVYTKTILKKVNGLTEEELRDRIESHLINYDLLVSDNFDLYFVERAKSILDLIESAMGKPVTDRSAENTINSFGSSLS